MRNKEVGFDLIVDILINRPSEYSSLAEQIAYIEGVIECALEMPYASSTNNKYKNGCDKDDCNKCDRKCKAWAEGYNRAITYANRVFGKDLPKTMWGDEE